jgi:hypothetical protein
LEGLILDDRYLKGLKSKFREKKGPFCGFGVDVKNFDNLETNWDECDTFIQNEGIVRDYGVFDSPDEFYGLHGTNLSGIKKFLYQNWVSKIMNDNVKKVRLLDQFISTSVGEGRAILTAGSSGPMEGKK